MSIHSGASGVVSRPRFTYVYRGRAISRDPSVYSDPDVFMPERFLKDGELDPNVRDPATFSFGYGRRYD